MKKLTKKQRQIALTETIERNPFITDEDLSKQFGVSIQTIRLDRMETGIKELRERIKSVATRSFEQDVKALELDEVIGEVIDMEIDKAAISMLEVLPEHVFTRNQIVRGHHLFAQANSLAVALIDADLALTSKSSVRFLKQVHLGVRVIAKATVTHHDPVKQRSTVVVESYVQKERVFEGEFELYRTMVKSEEQE
ncbi:MAG: transcription factor FapR [Bacilli bacterium]